VLPCNLGMGAPKSLNLLDAFRAVWDGIHVVDLDGNVQVFDTDPFFHVHIANTFENATGIVMDFGAYQDIPFAASPQLIADLFKNKTARDRSSHAEIWRLHMHLVGPQKGQVTKETFHHPGRTTDFFKINPAVNGRPYCFFYATEWFHDGKSYASMAILKQDLCRGTRTYWAKPNFYVGEPFFIGPPAGETLRAAATAEDDGFVLFLALDGRRGASDFVVLNATSFEEVAVVKLPVHIPFTAHGQFIPAAAQAVSATVGTAGHPDFEAALGAALVV